jgi:hypothetical protein
LFITELTTSWDNSIKLSKVIEAEMFDLDLFRQFLSDADEVVDVLD